MYAIAFIAKLLGGNPLEEYKYPAGSVILDDYMHANAYIGRFYFQFYFSNQSGHPELGRRKLRSLGKKTGTEITM